MKNKLDLIIKLIITTAIIVTLTIMVIPVLEDRGIIAKTSNSNPVNNQRPSGAPASGAPSGTPPVGERPAGQQPLGGKPAGEPGPAGGAQNTAHGSGAPSSAAGQAVNTYIASIGTVSNYIKVNGDVITNIQIDIFPDVAGKIIRQNVSVGDHVTRNQSVAVIDPSLPGQNFAESTVYTTISGTVLSVNARTGDKVSTNTSVLTIGDLSDLKLVTYIPEKFSGNLRTGLTAVATFAAFPDESFNARISEISPVIDPSSRTIEITLDFTNRQNKIKTGMFASIKLVTEQVDDVVAIPSPAVFKYYGEETVFVVKENNTVERRIVTTGLSSVEMVEIIDGLKAGEIVVTEGQSLLKEGSAVKIIGQEQ